MEMDIDVNAKTKKGYTPLYLAEVCKAVRRQIRVTNGTGPSIKKINNKFDVFLFFG